MGFPFADYIGLLKQFLDSRQGIVDRLERQLFGVRGKASALNGDRESIADIFTSCFFESPALSPHLSRLKGELEAAHRADGFEPALHDGYSRELSPVELALRGCHDWERTRWPGRNGRLGYAQSLYAAFMLRQLEHLSLRIWDEDNEHAIERLQHVQALLDTLNARGPCTEGLQLMRDARWLVQTAQSPLTRHLKPYFIKANHVAAVPDEVGLEIHKAGAVLAGGHLRSQLRHVSQRTRWPFDDRRLLALTRSSNSMDLALLVRDLIPLLDAYIVSCARQDEDARLSLADAILQGLSADPELLLTRLDLLEPSTMIEDLFVGTAGNARSYTEMGEAHREYLAQYRELIGRAAEPLLEDSRTFDPSRAVYSPLGIVYGFCGDLVANKILNTLRFPSSTLTLEDLFISRDRLEEKQTQAQQWTHLPKRDDEPAAFEHSIEWATQMSVRLATALEARAARPAEPNASSSMKSCFYVVPRGVAIESLADGVLPAGIITAQEHCLTSDGGRARLTGATSIPADRLIADRAEGRLLACERSEGAWFGVSKVLLTLCTNQGIDVLITDVPQAVIDVLRLVCPEMVLVIGK